jgi:hypothetical protein
LNKDGLRIYYDNNKSPFSFIRQTRGKFSVKLKKKKKNFSLLLDDLFVNKTTKNYHNHDDGSLGDIFICQLTGTDLKFGTNYQENPLARPSTKEVSEDDKRQQLIIINFHFELLYERLDQEKGERIAFQLFFYRLKSFETGTR